MKIERIIRNPVVLVAVGTAGPGVLGEVVLYWLTGGLIGWEPIVAALGGGVVVAAILAYLRRKGPTETSVTEPLGEVEALPPFAARPPQDGRTYTVRTVEELVSEVANLTGIAAQSTTQRHIGTWMCVRGDVHNVFVVAPDITAVTIGTELNRRLYVVSCFSGDQWKQTLATLNKGDNITVVGKIALIASSQVDLDDCEIVG